MLRRVPSDQERCQHRRRRREKGKNLSETAFAVGVFTKAGNKESRGNTDFDHFGDELVSPKEFLITHSRCSSSVNTPSVLETAFSRLA